MKIILLLLSLSMQTLALDFSITNLCDNSPYLKTSIQILAPANVGEISLYVFETFEVPFDGNGASFSSIINTPTGLESYEIISDNEMKVYGWCFQVNGTQPDRFMNEIIIDPSKKSHINWFYGFAHLKNNQWISYCTPAYEDRSSFICPE